MNKTNRWIDRWKPFSHSLVFALVMLALSACQLPGQSDPAPTPAPTAAVQPSPTPSNQPLGSAENPLLLAVVTEPVDLENESAGGDLGAAAAELAQTLADQSGYSVASMEFSNYADLIRALDRREVHIAWLPPLTYLRAAQLGAARVALLSNNFGVYSYGAQIIANVNTNLESFYDPAAGANTDTDEAIFDQLRGLRPCWVSLDSPSGYILPAGAITKTGVQLQPGAVLQSHTAVIRALYVKDICDFGATFAISGDPRTASNVQDLPYLMDQIQVIWRSDPVIPNLNLSYIPEMPQEIAQNLNSALITLAKTPEGQDLLTRANQYDIQGLREADDSEYDALKDAVKELGIDLKTTLGR